MADRPAPAPAPPLRPHTDGVPGPSSNWFAAHVAGLIALVMGVAGFAVVSLTTEKFWSTPDWRLTVPILVATAAAATVSIVRRERAVALPLLGVGLAAAAVVLGWFLITAIVVAVTAIVILLLSHAM
ncbi:MAG: hypothetical protein K8W52_09820 [Deltaproteobacteria bacterium]|nr:hypothetical protein [Deltaproteobacteria bacterium]